MATAASLPPTPGVGTGADATSTTLAAAAAAATSVTTPEAAAVTSPATAAFPAEQTTQTSTPLAANTSSTSSIDTSVSQVSPGQPSTISSSSQVLSSPALSTSPKEIAASSTASPVPHTGNGLGAGAVVGIAVGCAVAGLIIGLLVAFFMLKPRSKSCPEPKPELVETRTEGKSFDSRALTASPVEPPLAVSDLDQFLLAPKPDKELAGELQSLGHLIQQHVEDNYHLLPAKESISSLNQALIELGLAVDGKELRGPVQLADMSASPRMRHVALQHIISRVIFESLAVRSTSRLSMLPPAVSSLVREMPPCEKHLGSPEAISHALTRWRQISAFLLNPNRSERGSIVPDESSLAPQARELVAAMNGFLGAFVDEQNKSHQESHLQDVVLECARFGYTILSQPAETEWRFDTGNAEELVLCPGLEKVSDSQGLRCSPEVICPPEVHRV